MALGPDYIPAYESLKLKQTYEYVIYTLSDDLKTVIVDKTSDSDNYEDFLADLPQTECRFAVVDFYYEIEGAGGKQKKILFISWCVHPSPLILLYMHLVPHLN